MSNQEVLPWTEKYRPKTIEELILPRHIKTAIVDILSKRKHVNWLLIGAPGTGKTTLAKIIAATFSHERDILHLNASDFRGIQDIRDHVISFASTMPERSLSRTVILDEADYLTNEAFALLRKPMEELCENCIFVLTANYPHKIPKPIKSRCITIQTDDPPYDLIVDFLCNILDREDIRYDRSTIELLVSLNYPQIRDMLLRLQISVNPDNTINENILFDAHKDAADYVQHLIDLIEGYSVDSNNVMALLSIPTSDIAISVTKLALRSANLYKHPLKAIIAVRYLSVMDKVVDPLLHFRAMVLELVEGGRIEWHATRS